MGNWKSISGACLWLYNLVQSIFNLLGIVDFIVSHTKEIGWVGDVLDWLLTPPPGAVALTLVIGGGLLWWGSKRRPEVRPRNIPQASQMANLDAWRRVDPLYVWQAGCLWGGVAPQYPVTFFNPAYPDFSMILRAVEHGEIAPIKSMPKSKLAYSQLTRNELKKFAAMRGEKPAFLEETNSDHPLLKPSKRGLYWAGALGASLAMVITWNVVDYRQQLACRPNFEWLSAPQTIELHPQLNRPVVVRKARVTPLSQAAFFMTIEARGKGLDALYIFHQGVARDPSPTMWQLQPSGIAARALNPFSVVEVTAFIKLPHEVVFSEPQFSCAR